MSASRYDKERCLSADLENFFRLLMYWSIWAIPLKSLLPKLARPTNTKLSPEANQSAFALVFQNRPKPADAYFLRGKKPAGYARGTNTEAQAGCLVKVRKQRSSSNIPGYTACAQCTRWRCSRASGSKICCACGGSGGLVGKRNSDSRRDKG